MLGTSLEIPPGGSLRISPGDPRGVLDPREGILPGDVPNLRASHLEYVRCGRCRPRAFLARTFFRHKGPLVPKRPRRSWRWCCRMTKCRAAPRGGFRLSASTCCMPWHPGFASFRLASSVVSLSGFNSGLFPLGLGWLRWCVFRSHPGASRAVASPPVLRYQLLSLAPLVSRGAPLWVGWV